MKGTVPVTERQGRALHRSNRIAEHRCLGIFDRGQSAIRRTLRTFTESFAEARRVARAYDELGAMSDPELHDIGINRADIPAVVSGRYRGIANAIAGSASNGRRARSPSSGRPDPTERPRSST